MFPALRAPLLLFREELPRAPLCLGRGPAADSAVESAPAAISPGVPSDEGEERGDLDPRRCCFLRRLCTAGSSAFMDKPIRFVSGSIEITFT